MKKLSHLLVGLAMFCAMTGAAVLIHGWTIGQENKHVCRMLIEQQQKHEADVALGCTMALREDMEFTVALLESDCAPRCTDLTSCGRGLLGLAVSLLLFVPLARQSF